MKTIKILFILLIPFTFIACNNDEANKVQEKSEPIESTINENKKDSVNNEEGNLEEDKNEESSTEEDKTVSSSTKNTVEQKEIIIEEESEIIEIEEDPKQEVSDTPVEKNWVEKGEFINSIIGNDLSSDYQGDLLNDAANEVAIQKSIECGGEKCGKIVHLHNYNSTKDIKVAIELSWKINKESKKQKREYLVPAGSKLDLGCSADCSDAKKVKINWKIIGAAYSK